MMRYTQFVLICTVWPALIHAQIDRGEVPLKSRIREVTVFLKGAEIKRTASKTLNPGITHLVFTGLSSNINPTSVQVKAKGEVTIMSVQHRMNYITDENKPLKVQLIEDSIESIERRIRMNENRLMALEEEKALILANKSVKGNNIGLDVEELEYTADFFRERLPEVMNLALQIEEKNKKLNEQKNRILKQQKELNAIWSKSNAEIVVDVSANSKATGTFELSYLVYQAGWNPAYDLRADDINSPVQLFYKAEVYQNTGVDWNKTHLILSTGTPVLSGTKPELKPWVLSFVPPVYSPPSRYDTRNAALEEMPPTPSRARVETEEYSEKKKASTTADFTQMINNQVNTSFDISIPYAVPSDNKKHLVEIMHTELPATYRYYAAPKVDKAAFLLAHVTGWEELNLLSGQANLYFEGTYIGNSFIEANITQDTLDLSFGRDASVVISRKKIKNFTKNKIIGADKKVTIGIEISIRNTKNQIVEIDLKDQVPISSDKDIHIELNDRGGAQLEENTGFLKWKVKIEPSDTKTYMFRYTVTYPKNKKIYNF